MSEERYLTFALGKGRLAKKTLELFEQIGITCFVIVIDDLLEALSRQRVNIDMPASGKTVYYRAGDEADYLAKLSEVITLRKEGIPTVLSPEITENEEADQ